MTDVGEVLQATAPQGDVSKADTTKRDFSKGDPAELVEIKNTMRPLLQKLRPHIEKGEYGLLISPDFTFLVRVGNSSHTFPH